MVRRPGLWGIALVQTFRLARPGWWRRPPFVPVPPPDYLAFRLETQYGSGHHADPADVVTYLHWCREFRQDR